jgi:CheY-specific phosphatase CheX
VLDLNPTLLKSVVDATKRGLEMTGVKALPVGASRLISGMHGVSAIVGFTGQNSGSITLNLTEPAALYLGSRFLDEEHTTLTETCLDAIMEMGNIIAGSHKELLGGSEFHVAAISLPSLIYGESFSTVYARGITTVQVEFELPELTVARMQDRIFRSSISILRSSGRG